MSNTLAYVEERMVTLNGIKATTSTHKCPECSGNAYCAMEAGKSANLCWCMSEKKTTGLYSTETCLCRNCLTAYK